MRRTASGPDAAWLQHLIQAVEQENQTAIWSLMDEHIGNEIAQQLLADEVCRTAAPSQNGTTHTELYLVPVIAPNNCAIFNSREAWDLANLTMQGLIANWFGQYHRIQILDRIFPMEWIAAWDPSDLRRVLGHAKPGSAGPLPVISHALVGLPHSAPRLGFIAMTVTAQGHWPAVPPESRDDVRFADIARHTLCMASEANGVAPIELPAVLTPDRMQYAFADGACLWVRMLHERIGILGWHVQPTAVKQDSVNILLQLAHDQVPVTFITLRLHQIGAAGFQEVVAQLGMCAPNMDQIYF
jgi:hypothetical protein